MRDFAVGDLVQNWQDPPRTGVVIEGAFTDENGIRRQNVAWDDGGISAADIDFVSHIAADAVTILAKLARLV